MVRTLAANIVRCGVALAVAAFMPALCATGEDDRSAVVDPHGLKFELIDLGDTGEHLTPLRVRIKVTNLRDYDVEFELPWPAAVGSGLCIYDENGHETHSVRMTICDGNRPRILEGRSEHILDIDVAEFVLDADARPQDWPAPIGEYKVVYTWEPVKWWPPSVPVILSDSVTVRVVEPRPENRMAHELSMEARSHEQSRQLPEAARLFWRVASEYPNSPYAERALDKFLYFTMQRTAKIAFQEVLDSLSITQRDVALEYIERFPNGPSVSRALGHVVRECQQDVKDSILDSYLSRCVGGEVDRAIVKMREFEAARAQASQGSPPKTR